jgi:hypothetical protein
MGDLCYFAGEGEATYQARSGLRIRLRKGSSSVSARRDRALPHDMPTGWLGSGWFEVWTDPRPTPWLASLLGRQIWQCSKDGKVIIPYEFTASQEHREKRVMGPLFVVFFGGLTGASVWLHLSGH